MPNVMGAIDGTFIPIKAPSENPEVYVTRKCNTALTMQAICNSNLRFTDIFIGYPGSVHDARIFNNSDIFINVSANKNQFFPPNHYIIEDKAYPPLDWCVAPFINRGGLTAAQKRFNYIHAQTRQPIERSFALLFNHFRRLNYLDMSRLDLIPKTVLAACVLHNICLDDDNNFDECDEMVNNMNLIDDNQAMNMINDEIDMNIADEEMVIEGEEDNFVGFDLNGLQFRDQLCNMMNNQ
ncbi:uncharacterized protein LOC106693058 [Microplitis demolitor]|uniref:uncharacterized protein LOC106693058 n=1 Tax=Microplitis demolitor TaxID=69319 RepID=UPI0004CD73F0|nr:uncharacterized protein LOC106693058 [Microplitis demolitor]